MVSTGLMRLVITAVVQSRKHCVRLRIFFSELLRKADEQEWTEDGRDQCEKCVGEYLFVDPGYRIRSIDKNCMRNGGLENKVESRQQDNRNTSQAGRRYNSRLAEPLMRNPEVKSQV